MRAVCVVTGTRAEYGLLRPIMRRIRESPSLALQVVAAGMHLAREFGRTADLIEQDGFPVDARVDMLFGDDTGAAMAKGVGVGIYGFVQAFETLAPDIVLVLGDRVEPFAAAIAAGFLRLPLAHIHGGDTAGGGFDEYMRPAITRFAHLHFAATAKSRERLIPLGEREEFVFLVGAPGLDEAVEMSLLSRVEIERAFGLPADRPFLLIVQHPVSTEADAAEEQMRETLEAVKALGVSAVVLYPNSDAGGRAMIEVIKEYEGLPSVRVFRNLERTQYLSLLAAAGVLIGNSSSGMIESAYFKVPVVNIGSRQQGRERSGNVLDVDHDRASIARAIQTALVDPAFRERVRTCANPYGDGKASQRIVDILSTIPLDHRLLDKPFPA